MPNVSRAIRNCRREFIISTSPRKMKTAFGMKPAASLKSPFSHISGKPIGFASLQLFLPWLSSRQSCDLFPRKNCGVYCNCTNKRRLWRKNARGLRAICTTSLAQTSRKSPCLAKWPGPTKIYRTKSSRTQSKLLKQRERRRIRLMKLSGLSIHPTIRWKASPIMPANTRRNISH